jgi:DNA helicase-2/ATP-dependent DNA helicase PcrA
VTDAAVRGLLDGLNPGQREAVTTEATPLRILAGAGSGKTRVLTRRIAYRCTVGTADARHVLALTFTRKAAGELQHRLRALGLRDRPTAGTFHAIAYAQLQRRWADQQRPAPSLLQSKIPILARLAPRRDVAAPDLAAEIEWAKARLVTPDAYPDAAAAAHRRAPLPHGEIAALYARYEDVKHREGRVDFDDLLWQCLGDLERDPEFAAAQRWTFRHLFVDEFQDVNPLQARLLDAWRGGRTDLCVVGDPNQAIYAWNGAEPSVLTEFDRRHPGSATVVLDENYRSSPQILAVANAVLAAGSAGSFTRLRAARADGPLPEVRSYPTDAEEARGVARAARDLHGPQVPWSHQAVLSRTHAQGVAAEVAFRAAGIPARVRGRIPFLDLPEIKDELRILGRHRLGFEAALAGLEARVRPADLEAVESDGSGESDDDGPSLSDAEIARLQNLDVLLHLAGDYAASDPTPNVEGFRTWLLATVGRDDGDTGRDAVEISTFHAAKGLEWPIVHLMGLESGLVPIGHARTAEAQAEERRLFYVGITRAERVLRGSWAETRLFGDKPARRSPSPFLVEVGQVLEALRAGLAPDDWRPHVAAQRQALGARARRPERAPAAELDGPAASLLKELKRWRTETAKAGAVPAYVIFHDATLEAVARTRPGSRAALLRVPGVGPVKATRFGDDVLALVARHGDN